MWECRLSKFRCEFLSGRGRKGRAACLSHLAVVVITVVVVIIVVVVNVVAIAIVVDSEPPALGNSINGCGFDADKRPCSHHCGSNSAHAHSAHSHVFLHTGQ